MPYPSEHSARINEPSKYKKTRRENDKFGSGINVMWGVKDDGKTEVQAIRFDKTKFTVAQAKAWLKEHDYHPIEFEPASEKSRETNAMEYKVFTFEIAETKNNIFDGKSIGTIKGYASTYGTIDRTKDVIFEGAFDDSIQDYKSKNRTIKVYYQHNTSEMPIGGIKPENINSDKTGLPVTIDVNTKVQRGSEVYELAKQGVLSDMSIGFTVDDYDYAKDGVRCLKKLSLWEISIVGEPANPLAKVTEVKGANKNKFYTITDLENIVTKRDYENILRESGAFSKEAATFLAAHFIEKARSESDTLQDTKTNSLAHLIELKNLLNKL
jgi:uncharacterized protein